MLALQVHRPLALEFVGEDGSTVGIERALQTGVGSPTNPVGETAATSATGGEGFLKRLPPPRRTAAAPGRSTTRASATRVMHATVHKATGSRSANSGGIRLAARAVILQEFATLSRHCG
mmetsp:Transcript_10163/g.26143  ORF Transcript_10163/g.26143 Transcript_10163/m.26143 type:complete len:119 (+) Transcript_10163:227-583(+)